jgi:hypothetical protein
MKRVTIKNYKVPQRYVPKNLTKKDREIQKKYIDRSRRAYKKGKYFLRPTLKSFKQRHSSHVNRAREIYNVESMKPTKTLARKTGCSMEALEKIVNKGRGAYYSSGSRPNQTPDSWGYARLASAITGGPSSKIDYTILENGCKNMSIPLKMALK